MRLAFVLLHRWLGLATALFLFIAGLTGAIISWDHELDEWLNPKLFHSTTQGTPLSVFELARKVELSDPRARVIYFPLENEPGHAFTALVQPKIDPALQRPYELDYNQVAVDPVTGTIQARRMWGQAALDREHLLPFLYKLHYSLHIPDVFGIEAGIWFMGVVGILWVVDSCIALYISFPARSSWRKSFAFRWKQGGYKLTFDLHRSGGVWVWLFLLILAVTSVSMNLKQQVVKPVVSWFSDVSPTILDARTPAPIHQPIEPQVAAEAIVAAARQEGHRLGWQDPAGGIFLSTEIGIYGVTFFKGGNSHGDGGLGNPSLYFDSRTGKLAGDDVPGAGTAGDIFLQSMFPLHSGRIIGLPGRIFISFMGLVVAMLSATGLYIWLKKRRAQLKVA